VVKEVGALGDKVGEGKVLIVVEAEARAPARPPRGRPGCAPAAAPVAARRGQPRRRADVEYDMVVLGAGPGGYSAAFRAADLGLKTAIIERYATLGGVCLNVGCIPSKALLHVAAVMDEAEHVRAGVSFAKPTVDDALRAHKDKVVGKLTGGLAGMAKGRKVDVIRGYGTSSTRTTSKSKKPPAPARTRPAPRRSSSSSSASSPPARRVHLPFIPATRASSIPPARWNCASCPARCWSSAAASSAWKWPPSIPPSAPASTWSR
jgi:dihydrolipoamide dehydrogenase